MTIIQSANGPSLHLVPMCYITLKEVLSSYESLKKYNDENVRNSEISLDDDLEHEFEGKYFQKRFLHL